METRYHYPEQPFRGLVRVVTTNNGEVIKVIWKIDKSTKRANLENLIHWIAVLAGSIFG